MGMVEAEIKANIDIPQPYPRFLNAGCAANGRKVPIKQRVTIKAVMLLAE